MNIKSYETFSYKGCSEEIGKQLEKINEYNNKMNKLLLQKIITFENENQMLTNMNKGYQTELKHLETSLRNSKNEVHNIKENYQRLRSENKNLLAKLQSIKELEEHNRVDCLEVLPRKRRKVKNENSHNSFSSSNSYFSKKGLVIVYNLT